MRLFSARRFSRRRLGQVLLLAACVCAGLAVFGPAGKTAASEPPANQAMQADNEQSSPGLGDSIEEAQQRSAGCVSCHNPTDSATMHTTGTVRLGCTDCHGGNAQISLLAGVAQDSPQYREVTKQAHPRPRFAENARTSGNPVRAYTQWLKEDRDYIKFVNPGDLRVAQQTCGRSGCHTAEVQRVRTSMMTVKLIDHQRSQLRPVSLQMIQHAGHGLLHRFETRMPAAQCFLSHKLPQPFDQVQVR